MKRTNQSRRFLETKDEFRRRSGRLAMAIHPRRKLWYFAAMRLGITSRPATRIHALFVWACCVIFLATLGGPTLVEHAADDAQVHGLWVWKGPTILRDARDAEKLRDFCQAQGINEVYVSVSERGQMMAEGSMSRVIETLHRANIRTEALFSSENADEGGNHLEKLLADIRTVVRFNQNHPQTRFDGVHLDIEPQQRPENKAAGNLAFLPGLVDAYRAIRRASEPAGLTVNADIQNKLLKAVIDQRRMLLSSLPRLTLMMYGSEQPE